MPRQKLTRPCAVKDCISSVKFFRNVTQDLKDKTDNIVNFVATQISENKKPRIFIDLGDIIETIEIISNNTPVDNTDYLEQKYIE
ncbi:20686_t:CDS:2 [Dentiscutata erythropus]|uniref:20686_t:CDS:1 n=1 Tax=Dentiscutata erythropus TaxID=1348616 RepID=A0A9N9H862_9GLOM|nr:20686_t:CDS:2 [Dentiscutata erythropus]